VLEFFGRSSSTPLAGVGKGLVHGLLDEDGERDRDRGMTRGEAR
jgi:hypothetical protein